MSRRRTKEEFIEISQKIHGDAYDYTEFVYPVSNKTKTIIKCKQHGEFYQRPNDHMSGYGCPLCGLIAISEFKRSSAEMFIEKANSKHGGKYDYNLINYKLGKSKISIHCPIHGWFIQKAADHLAGNGCKKCTSYLTKDWVKRHEKVDCTFYVLRCYNEMEAFIKIGITAVTIEKRYDAHSKMPYNYEIVQIIKGTGQQVWEIEEYIKNNTKDCSYVPSIKFKGYRYECYLINKLNVINEAIKRYKESIKTEIPQDYHRQKQTSVIRLC